MHFFFKKNTMRFKSYDEHFHEKISTSLNDALQTLVTILHTSSWTILKSIVMQNLIQISHKVQEL